MASGPLGTAGYEYVRGVLEAEGSTLSETSQFGWEDVGIFGR
jgi:hypothetical protein